MDEMGKWAMDVAEGGDELRVSAAGKAWLADRAATWTARGAAGTADGCWMDAGLSSVPVVVDPQLTGGQWVVMAGGEAEASGDVAPASGPQWHVDYVRGLGWIEVNLAELDRLTFGGERDGR